MFKPTVIGIKSTEYENKQPKMIINYFNRTVGTFVGFCVAEQGCLLRIERNLSK